ncbi:uncharacterized protein LOC132727176 [Ruditapes philippinarum]|uniref:uncharacterized protein LOC132727176 n=1 Tax=Ruditapes philippinarum TaxID=129788 RepID=UPI00295AF008|nr:uncharacterized protein LOC132727176 [Ruditapes philippinarum]
MQITPCGHIFGLILLCITCNAKVEREKTYTINGLLADVIDVDLRSEIPGQITWILTDDHNFRLKVNIAGENEEDINTVDINLTNTSSSVKLLVREKHFSIAPAPVTGTGNVVTIPAFLVWLLALMISWNNPMPIMLMVAVYGFTPGTAETTYGFSKKSVDIEVKAPRRFSYNAVSLTINGGKLRVVNWEKETTKELTCKTEATSENGCSDCCHGNGVCVRNKCICDANYDEMSNCATSVTESILFSHPLDPRFDRTHLPNKDVVTLGRVFQFIQHETYLKDPDKYALEINSEDLMFPQILIIFHSNGFIEKIIDTKTVKGNTMKFKKSRLNPCVIRLKGRLVDREINVCGTNNSVDGAKYIENEITSKENEERESLRDKNNDKGNMKKKRRHKHALSSENNFNFLELPVRIHRCGYNSKQRKFVFFKIFKDKMDSYHDNISRIKSNISHGANENIYLLSHKTLHETESLRIPDQSVPLGIEKVTQKCELTKYYQRKICSTSNLESMRTICDDLWNNVSQNNTTPPQFSKTIHLCTYVLNKVSTYCDKHISLVLTPHKSCLSNYVNNFNLFSKRIYLIQPFVIFPDDKLISGQVQHVSFGNKSQSNLQNKELVITDNNSEFKIVKISVIPTDPVPHDIYQVRLDYACATSETAIKMTVYGSDFYSNSVTCRGVTHCNCCILHAAGAPNAVVDRVTINVTDHSRNYELVREMVVVF